MVDITYTMTCNHCHRYLSTGDHSYTGVVIEAEDLPLLLNAAEERGWQLQWLPSDAGEAPSHCLCAHCCSSGEEFAPRS